MIRFFALFLAFVVALAPTSFAQNTDDRSSTERQSSASYEPSFGSGSHIEIKKTGTIKGRVKIIPVKSTWGRHDDTKMGAVDYGHYSVKIYSASKKRLVAVAPITRHGTYSVRLKPGVYYVENKVNRLTHEHTLKRVKLEKGEIEWVNVRMYVKARHES